MTVQSGPRSRYDELYRPQFHFSPAANWINDPNGLVFYKGEYHLFYQHDPHSLSNGPMHWGHAVSPDLIHWVELPIALYPDEIGKIWSGSAVVDADNTSGLVPDGGLIAMFSYDNQSQGIAYSIDNGRTWSKYPGNPVIPVGGKDFRDPKVFWYEPARRWAMILAASDRAKIYSSPDLIDWTLTGEFGAGQGVPNSIWECTDLFLLTIDGRTHWILIVSVMGSGPFGGRGTHYFVGDFNGSTFTTSDTTIRWLDHGPDNYAGVTWNNVPDHRRIFIGWMSNWTYGGAIPTSSWRGAMTIPRLLTLRNSLEGVQLMQTPVPEVDQLRELPHQWRNQTLTPGSNLLSGLTGTALDIVAEFDPGSACLFGFKVRKNADDSQHTVIGYEVNTSTLFVDRTNSGNVSFDSTFAGIHRAPIAPNNGHIKLRILLDWSSVEVFGNDGEVVITEQIFPDAASDQLELFALGGDATLIALDIYPMKRIWP